MSRKQSTPANPTDPADADGWRNAADIARRIQRMTLVVRNDTNPLMGHGVGLTSEQAAKLAAEHLAEQVLGQGPGNGVDIPLGTAAEEAAGAQGEDAGSGWWVLAQGRLLDPQDFATREAAREDLLAAVHKAGVQVAENIWVWDETGRAQLVLATLPTRERAQRVAERLRGKGLNITVRREMPQQG